MTIELPEGAKSFSLPNGQTIDVPIGAKSMDLPDELMKPTQYSGGFNQPQKQAWTQDEINKELQQPWEKFISGISSGVGKAYDTLKNIPTSPAEYMTRKALEASSDKYKQGFQAYDKQQEAISAMAREDALDESSKWSNIYDSFFGDNKEQLNVDTRARLAKKYDETFKTSGLGRLGEDDNGDYYLIDKEGNNVPLNSFASKLAGDMKANGGTMGASIAGGMTGARYGASLPIADPRLKALATTIGALGGSAVGAFTGSVGDTAVNASRNGREFDIDFALKKATEEAVADGLIGGTVELGIKGAKAAGGLAKGLKEYAIDGNLNGARSLATEKAGVNPSDIHASRSAYETVPNESARELAQDELASAAMSRERLWNEVAPEVKGDVKASTEVANTTTSRANALLEQAEKGAIEPEEVIKQIKAYENDVKSTYGQMVDDIAKIAPDFKATTDDVQATLQNAIDNVIGTETDAQLKKILNIVQKQDAHSVQDLFALRKKVNAISTDNFEDLAVIRQLNEQLNDKIGKAIDTIPDEAMASRLKEGFNQNRQRYAEMFKMQDQDIYKDIMKSSINPEEASRKLLYYAKAYQDRLNEITKNIAPEARAGIEMRVITDAIKDSLVETSDGFKAIDFKSLSEMVKKINTSNLKSENAKVLLETIDNMHKLFGLDAQMLTDVAKGVVKQPMSGIATSISGRFEAMRTSFATKFLLSYLPTQAGKSMAFKRHVLESLRKARSPKEFLTLAEQYPNAPKTIWKQMRQTIDEYEQKLAQEQEIAFKQQEQEKIAKEAEDRALKEQAEQEAIKAKEIEEWKKASNLHMKGYVGSPVANSIVGGGTGSAVPTDYNGDGEVSIGERGINALIGALGGVKLGGKFNKGAKQTPKEAPNGMRNGMIVGIADDKVFHTSAKEIDTKLSSDKVFWTTPDLFYSKKFGRGADKNTYSIRSAKDLVIADKKDADILREINIELPKEKQFSEAGMFADNGEPSAFLLQEPLFVEKLKQRGFDGLQGAEDYKGNIPSIGIFNKQEKLVLSKNISGDGFEMIGTPKSEIEISDEVRELAGITDKRILADLNELLEKHPNYFKNTKSIQRHITKVKDGVTHYFNGSNPDNAILAKNTDELLRLIGIEKNGEAYNKLVHASKTRNPNEIKRLIRRHLEGSPTPSLLKDGADGADALSSVSYDEILPQSSNGVNKRIERMMEWHKDKTPTTKELLQKLGL